VQSASRRQAMIGFEKKRSLMPATMLTASILRVPMMSLT